MTAPAQAVLNHLRTFWNRPQSVYPALPCGGVSVCAPHFECRATNTGRTQLYYAPLFYTGRDGAGHAEKSGKVFLHEFDLPLKPHSGTERDTAEEACNQGLFALAAHVSSRWNGRENSFSTADFECLSQEYDLRFTLEDDWSVALAELMSMMLLNQAPELGGENALPWRLACDTGGCRQEDGRFKADPVGRCFYVSVLKRGQSEPQTEQVAGNLILSYLKKHCLTAKG